MSLTKIGFYRFICISLLGLLASCSQANESVAISDAWVRAMAPGQKVGAAYMTLKSTRDTTLVKVESPAAGSVEIHSMTMDNGVMKMRMLETLPLTGGKAAKLEPGGFHLMLFDLKQPLKAGDKVEFTLSFKDSAGKASSIKITSPVKTGND
jgi:periplasmic copper chaperone A